MTASEIWHFERLRPNMQFQRTASLRSAAAELRRWASTMISRLILLGSLLISPLASAAGQFEKYLGMDPWKLPEGCAMSDGPPDWQSDRGVRDRRKEKLSSKREYLALYQVACYTSETGTQQRKLTRMIWLTERAPHSHEKAVDVIAFPAFEGNESMMQRCSLKGQDDDSMFAMGVMIEHEEQSPEGEPLEFVSFKSQSVRTGWRVNKMTKKIEQISGKGVVCSGQEGN